MDTTNNVSWATSLIRLFKSGTIDNDVASVPSGELAQYFATELDEDSDELKHDLKSNGIIGMFKQHIHPNLTKDAVELMNRRDGIVPIMNKIKSHQAPF